MEKASYHLKNSEKGCKRSDGAVWKAKKLNDGFTNPHSTLVYALQSLKTHLQNKPENTRALDCLMLLEMEKIRKRAEVFEKSYKIGKCNLARSDQGFL